MSINAIKKSSGFTLLEVMIAMVIFSIGLLGLAGIQAVSLNNNHSAYTRTVSMQLAYNIADVIRTSTDNAGLVTGSFDAVTSSIPSTAPTSCVQKNGGGAPNCNDAVLASFEIYHWKKRIEDTLPSGLGTISKTGDVYTITIMWDEDRTGATGEACGSNSTTDLKCYSLEIQT
ncbi:MAG: type IV pilus modification protein PilV [Woeseiaceae bacterium]